MQKNYYQMLKYKTTRFKEDTANPAYPSLEEDDDLEMDDEQKHFEYLKKGPRDHHNTESAKVNPYFKDVAQQQPALEK